MASYFYKGISITPPTGSITAYLGNTDPDGWVICDGITRNVSDSRYANLVTMVIGTGNANTYTPPDYRGAFLRGSNKGTSTTTANTTYGSRAPDLKNSQNHMTETHSHSASSGNQSAYHTHTGTTGNQSAYHTHTGTPSNQTANHTHTGTTGNVSNGHTHSWNDKVAGNSGGSGSGLNGADNDNNLNSDYQRTGTTESDGDHTHTATTASSGEHTHTLTINNDGSHTHTITIGQDGVHSHSVTINNSTTNNGSETRPYNYGVNWILKI
jgi:microcystin-dependent protein